MLTIGDVTLDGERGLAWRNEELLKSIDGIHFRLLWHFFERPDEEISKDELKTLWKRKVVMDNSVERAISDLRKMLGDAGQALIKALGNRIYKLDAKGYCASLRQKKQEKGELTHAVLATSDLIVVRSITESWGLSGLLGARNIEYKEAELRWNDSLIEKLQGGKIHVAIYNQRRANALITGNPDVFDRVTVLRSIGASMGGKNYYVLAHRGSLRWQRHMAWEDFCNRLTDDDVILAPKQSDLLETFGELVIRFGGRSTPVNPRVIPIGRSIDALDTFDGETLGDALLMAGTNARTVAEYSNRYRELINYDSFPVAGQCLLQEAATNCVLINKDLVKSLGGEAAALDIFRECERNFRDKWSDVVTREALIERLMAFFAGSRADEPHLGRYMVLKIVWESYRLGPGNHECLRLEFPST